MVTILLLLNNFALNCNVQNIYKFDETLIIPVLTDNEKPIT